MGTDEKGGQMDRTWSRSSENKLGNQLASIEAQGKG